MPTIISNYFLAAGSALSRASSRCRKLGIQPNLGSVDFPWKDERGVGHSGHAAWFMHSPINPGVDAAPPEFKFVISDLDQLLERASRLGIVLERHYESEFGRFATLIDTNRVRIEVWQPAE